MENACRTGNLEAVKGLVNVDRNRALREDASGQTPLHRVAAYNHMEILNFLIDCRADVNALDRYGDSALKKAIFNGHYEVVFRLIEMGADVNVCDHTGKTPLHFAAEKGDAACVELMIEKGANVNAEIQGQHYLTPLHLAAIHGHNSVCKALLAAGSIIDSQAGKDHSCALHLASEGGHTTTVRLLIGEGADVSIRDKHGRKAVHVCKDRKTRDVFDSFRLRATVHPAACTVKGPGVAPLIEATEKSFFLIQLRDRNGNLLQDQGGMIKASVDVQDLHTGQTREAEVEPHEELAGPMVYFNASVVGHYAVHVRIANALDASVDSSTGRLVPIAGSPFLVEVVPTSIDGYCSRARGDGITRTAAGLPTSFSIFARDRFQNACVGAQQDIHVHISQRRHSELVVPMDLNISECEGGRYDVEYLAPYESGIMFLSVSVTGGKHIYNSPFEILISPGEAVAEMSEVEGRCVSRAACGLENSFLVHVRDAVGNHHLEGGLTLHVDVYPEVVSAATMKIEARVEDRSNGVYECFFLPVVAGPYVVRVLLGNKHIFGSPFKCQVLEVPQWESEEVALFLSSIGFPQYRHVVMQRDIRGHMLAQLDVDLLEGELNIHAKGHQNRILQEIRRLVGNDEFDTDDLVVPDHHLLIEIGVNNKMSRSNFIEISKQQLERVQECVEPEKDYMLLPLLRRHLFAHGEKLAVDLQETTENEMSKTMQDILSELYSGGAKDGFAISRGLRLFEANLKLALEKQIRNTTQKDDVDEEGEDAAA
mmetsp:Transcript_6497/g.23095  ORF Transcript_6497/g.23095 Transcript_6497/m.23095 type:complete len:766 (-) Transcript_6497:95-2392(-)